MSPFAGSSTRGNSTIKIAIVGCGAVVEQLHLPRLMRRDDCCVTALVEPNQARAKTLAEPFGIPDLLTDYHELCKSDVDAVVVALPNHLHAPVSIDLLTAGLHVLVEKPMGLSVAECDAMLRAAESGGAVLSVGLVRRYAQAGWFAKSLIDGGFLGRIDSFDVQDGFVYRWPVASDAFLRKEVTGGGVLMDLGVHTLDQVLWWLGDVKSFVYYDDNYGGVEADCKLDLIMESGAKGIVECSRTRNLRQTALIRGELAELEVSLVGSTVTLRVADDGMSLTGHAASPGEPALPRQRESDLIAAEHSDFLAAIREGRPPSVTGADGRRSIALIQACYAERRPLNLPWVHLDPASRMSEASL